MFQPHPAGIAGARALAEPFAAGGPIVLLLGDNLFEFEPSELVDRFKQPPDGALLVVSAESR